MDAPSAAGAGADSGKEPSPGGGRSATGPVSPPPPPPPPPPAMDAAPLLPECSALTAGCGWAGWAGGLAPAALDSDSTPAGPTDDPPAAATTAEAAAAGTAAPRAQAGQPPPGMPEAGHDPGPAADHVAVCVGEDGEATFVLDFDAGRAPAPPPPPPAAAADGAVHFTRTEVGWTLLRVTHAAD